MSIHGVHNEAMTAQAQYAEWLRRLQAEHRAKVAVKTDEAEAEREAASEDPGSESDDAETPLDEGKSSDDDGEGRLRSFA
jgi:sRNA-binding protein